MSVARRTLLFQAEGLVTRLRGLEPMSLSMPMVPAAQSQGAVQAIDRHLAREQCILQRRLGAFIGQLRREDARCVDRLQARFTLLRLQFNALLSGYDIFADVLNQRGEQGTGVRLAGMDHIARDVMSLPGRRWSLPPLLCYAERGLSAAIRRVATRLPGGAVNPVALVRIPRERMYGTDLASSLAHEVGHQSAAFLNLVPSFVAAVQRHPTLDASRGQVWKRFAGWMSEIVPDFWALLKLGVTSVLGLVNVLSLPASIVTEVRTGDAHPVPWLRIRLACAIGHRVFPDRQWRALDRAWRRFYPPRAISSKHREALRTCDREIPALARLLVDHRPDSLGGVTLPQALAVGQRQPCRLRQLAARAGNELELLAMPPSLALACIGQARMDGDIDAEMDADLVGRLLRRWALAQPLGDERRVVAG